MKRQVTTLVWPAGNPFGQKQTVVNFAEGLDMVAARRQYAQERDLTLLVERSDGLVALYWDRSNRLIRLGIDPID